MVRETRCALVFQIEFEIYFKKKLKGFGMNLLGKIFTECSLIN